MTQTVQTVYLSPKRTYLIRCPHCGAAQEYHVSELPHIQAPLPYECSCGTVSHVRLISFRCAPRKDVHLSAVLVRQTANGLVRVPATVENLSVKGARVKIETLRNLDDDTVKMLMVVPARIRRSLDITCRVRRINHTPPPLRIALEFLGLQPDLEAALDEYLETI